MRMTHWLVSAIGGAALGFLVLPAQAAPVGALTGNAGAAQEAGASVVEQARHRCYRHRGHLHCPRHSGRYYRHYGYAPYYYGPGFSFYVGPRHHRHRHWRW